MKKGGRWVSMKFKDVPLRTEFGFGDYSHYKITDTIAVADMCGEQFVWDPEVLVHVEVFDGE